MRRILFILMAMAMITCCCKKNKPEQPPPEQEPDRIPIRIHTEIVNEKGYENGDKIGVYVVNYTNDVAGKLSSTGNHLDNTKFTFNGTDWKAESDVYWLDQTTPADFYCYYPYSADAKDASSLSFSVKEDQSTSGNLKASRLFYGRTEGAEPSDDPVDIMMNHALSTFIINLVPGSGYSEETLASEAISISVSGLKTKAKLNLATGDVTADGDPRIMTPYGENGCWKAIVVPQETKDNMTVTVTVASYEHTINPNVTFEQDRQHTCTLRIDRIGEGVNIIIDGWESDDMDFGGTLD